MTRTLTPRRTALPAPVPPTPPATPPVTALATVDLGDDLLELSSKQQVAEGYWLAKQRDPNLVPTWVLEAPIWVDDYTAGRASTLRAAYDSRGRERLVVETSNSLPRKSQEASAHGEVHGLLRVRDLDVLMAISQQCIDQRTRHIEMEIGRLLSWLGVDAEKNPKNYRDVRASVMRLAATQLTIYPEGLDAVAPKEEMPLPFSILVNDGRDKTQTPGIIRGALSDYWANGILQGDLWQLVDMRAYRHLLFQSESRLARVIYLFLSSLRQRDNTFVCQTSWLEERWADRLKGKYRYQNPYDKRGRLYEALAALQATGVMEISLDDPGTALRGSFAEPARMPALPPPIRRRSAEPPRLDLPPAPPQRSLLQPAEAEAPAGPTSGTAEAAIPSSAVLGKIAPLAADLAPQLFDQAVESGWVRLQVQTLVSYAHWNGRIRDKSAWIAKMLRSCATDEQRAAWNPRSPAFAEKLDGHTLEEFTSEVKHLVDRAGRAAG